MRWGLLVAVLVAPSVAFAQPAMTGTPVLAPPIPIPPGQDTLAAPDGRDVLVLEPLRRDLIQPYVPHAYNTPGCEPAGVATGMPGFAHEGATALGIHPFGHGLFAPRLTLFGFSRGGCAFDTAVGGGAVLSIPITKDVFFAWSGGAIYLPQNGSPNPNRSAETSMGLVFRRADGGSYNVGISAGNAGGRVSFGGTF